MGQIRKHGNCYWIRYYRDGRRYEENAGAKHGDAVDLLRKREGDISNGVPVTPKLAKITFEDAARDAVSEFTSSGKRSLVVFTRRIDKHLLPCFQYRRLSMITTGDIRQFIAERQKDTVLVRKARLVRTRDGFIEAPEIRKPVSNAEINRELQTLKRIFNLAIENGRLLHRPYVPLLKESAPRSGFLEPEQMAEVLAHIPGPARAVAQFAYVTGWRIPSEVLKLEWRQVDFDANEIRIDPGVTKGGEGRVFPMTPDVRKLLEAQRAQRDALKKHGIVCPYVFQRNGKPITSIIKAFKAGCRAAGYPGRIPHDLRRSAVRNLVRSGIPESVAMKLTGHRTRSVFDRYNISSADDLREATSKLSDRLAGTKWGQMADQTALAVGETSSFLRNLWRRRPDLNRRMEVLQTSALPLGYGALSGITTKPRVSGREKVERETGFEPATSTLARSHSTTELFPLANRLATLAQARKETQGNGRNHSSRRHARPSIAS